MKIDILYEPAPIKTKNKSDLVKINKTESVLFAVNE